MKSQKRLKFENGMSQSQRVIENRNMNSFSLFRSPYRIWQNQAIPIPHLSLSHYPGPVLPRRDRRRNVVVETFSYIALPAGCQQKCKQKTKKKSKTKQKKVSFYISYLLILHAIYDCVVICFDTDLDTSILYRSVAWTRVLQTHHRDRWSEIFCLVSKPFWSKFFSKIACLCQSIEINNNKHVYRQSQVRKPTDSGV